MIEKTDIEKVYRISEDRIADTSLGFKRYNYSTIDWESRLICIKGVIKNAQGN